MKYRHDYDRHAGGLRGKQHSGGGLVGRSRRRGRRNSNSFFPRPLKSYGRFWWGPNFVNLVAAKPEVTIDNVRGCCDMYSGDYRILGHCPRGLPAHSLALTIPGICGKLEVIYIKFIPIFRSGAGQDQRRNGANREDVTRHYDRRHDHRPSRRHRREKACAPLPRVCSPRWR